MHGIICQQRCLEFIRIRLSPTSRSSKTTEGLEQCWGHPGVTLKQGVQVEPVSDGWKVISSCFMLSCVISSMFKPSFSLQERLQNDVKLTFVLLLCIVFASFSSLTVIFKTSKKFQMDQSWTLARKVVNMISVWKRPGSNSSWPFLRCRAAGNAHWEGWAQVFTCVRISYASPKEGNPYFRGMLACCDVMVC